MHIWILTSLLAGFLALTSPGTARAADTDVIRNGDFNNGLDQWVLSLDLPAAWNPLSNGWVSLHPPTQGFTPFTGKIIYQNLNVTGISGKTFHFSMDLLKVNAWDGNAIAVKVTYLKNDGTREKDQVINPSNNEISSDPSAPTNITTTYSFPDDASKLVKIAIVKKGDGEFKVDNIRFTADGITVGPLPGITAMSTSSGAPAGPYGTSLTLTGTNFGATQGTVTLAGSADGVAVTAWSDTSITATISDPARSGAVRVVADAVESDPNFRFAVTSPNYTVGVVDDKKTAIKGQNVEFLFKVDFKHGFVPQNGIAFSLASSLPAGVTGTFLPGSPLMEPGGAVFRINTSGLSAGEYELTIQASDTGSQARTVHCTLNVVTIDRIRFFDDPYDSSSPDITQKTVTVQNEFQFGAEAVDSEGNTWGSENLDFQTSNSGVVQIYNGFWGPQFYAVDDGDAVITATAPDGTPGGLTVTVDLRTDYPKITGISLSPGSIANTDDQTPMTFHADCDDGFSWIGTDSSGMNSFSTTFRNPDTQNYPDEYETNDPTFYENLFHLTNPPSDLGTPLFYASSGASKRIVPLSVINGPNTGELKGKVKILDNTFTEMFVLEFYDPADTSTPAFTREIFTMHGRSAFDIGGIPPGDYLLRLRDDTQAGAQPLFAPQWYPNASTPLNAQPVTFTAGQTIEHIYFFIRSTPAPAISGAASYGGNLTGNVRVSVVDESGDEADVDDVTASANGNFYFSNVPDGIYRLYAYLDTNDDNKYTTGEPYGYFLADNGSTGHVIIAEGHPVGEIYVTLEGDSGATGISGTITSTLSVDDQGSVVLWPHGVIPVNTDLSNMQGDFPDTAIGVDLTIPPGDTPYQVTNFDWGDGPPIPPGTYDVVFVTSGDQDPDNSGVVRGLRENVVITKGSMTTGIDFTVSPGGTLSGTVQSDAQTPFPIPDAELMLFSGTQTNATFQGFAETDHQGHYEMQNVPQGTYFLVVHADGFEDFVLAPVSVTTGQVTTPQVSLTSENGYGQVQLTITDNAGDPIQGEQRAYLLEPGDDEPVGFLQPDPQNPGVFASYVLPGDYILVGSARGYQPSAESISVSQGDNITKTAQLSGPKDAVTAGVNWLLDQQNADGSFGPDPAWNNDPYIMGWSGYAALALLSIRNNPNLGLDQALLDRIDNALDDPDGSTDGTKGAKQYFLGLYHDTDDPGTPWNDVGAFFDQYTTWASVAATPVALERLLALGLPLNDPKVTAAVQFLLNAQVTALKAKDPMFAGGWRYNPADTDTDNWETPWVIMALMKAGLNPAEPHVAAGIQLIRNSQLLSGEDAGLFRYMPGDTWAVSGASAACMTALGFAGIPRTDPTVDLFFQWAQDNPLEIHADNGPASDCYYWSMLAWASSLYPDETLNGKTEYETLELTWNIADYAYLSQNPDGHWDNPAPKPDGSQSANSVMFTACALMALAPHTAALAPPETKTVSGTVSDPNGSVSGARVEARLNGIPVVQALTDGNGGYQLAVPVGQAYTLMAASPGYARTSRTTDVVTDDLPGQDIAFDAADADNVAPTAGTFVPADGSTLAQPAPEISAVLNDDHAGIDPGTIVMKLDGTPVYAVYDEGTGKLTMTPVPDMANGSHTVTVDFKDYAENAAAQASWTFTLDVWRNVPGDVNNSGQVDLGDAVSALQVMTGKQTLLPPHSAADVDGDGKIGLAEAVYILQSVAGLR